MEVTIVLVLLVAGIVFFLAELFLLPGVSIAGVAGTVLLAASVYYAYSHIGSTAGHLTLTGGIVLFGIAVWIFMRSKTLDKMSLKTEIDGKNDPLADVVINVGDFGITSSRLAPMGKVKVNGHIVEAKTNDDFIDQGVEVEVVEVMKTNILVIRK